MIGGDLLPVVDAALGEIESPAPRCSPDTLRSSELPFCNDGPGGQPGDRAVVIPHRHRYLPALFLNK